MEHLIVEPKFEVGDVVYVPPYIDYSYLLMLEQTSTVVQTILKDVAARHQNKPVWYLRCTDGWEVISSPRYIKKKTNHYYNLMNFIYHVYEI